MTVKKRESTEHERRDQIVAVAIEHFSHFGYRKTTVADLAREIGVSPAYIYRFFASKQEIGEAVCSACLSKVSAEVESVAARQTPTADRLSQIFRVIAQFTTELLRADRKIHDLAATSFNEGWASAENHQQRLHELIAHLISEGRKSGEFERRTPLSETSQAVMLALQSFGNPNGLERRFDTLERDAELLANLALRSLAP